MAHRYMDYVVVYLHSFHYDCIRNCRTLFLWCNAVQEQSRIPEALQLSAST